jgi:hypothetical protein
MAVSRLVMERMTIKELNLNMVVSRREEDIHHAEESLVASDALLKSRRESKKWLRQVRPR